MKQIQFCISGISGEHRHFGRQMLMWRKRALCVVHRITACPSNVTFITDTSCTLCLFMNLNQQLYSFSFTSLIFNTPQVGLCKKLARTEQKLVGTVCVCFSVYKITFFNKDFFIQNYSLFYCSIEDILSVSHQRVVPVYAINSNISASSD